MRCLLKKKNPHHATICNISLLLAWGSCSGCASRFQAWKMLLSLPCPTHEGHSTLPVRSIFFDNCILTSPAQAIFCHVPQCHATVLHLLSCWVSCLGSPACCDTAKHHPLIFNFSCTPRLNSRMVNIQIMHKPFNTLINFCTCRKQRAYDLERDQERVWKTWNRKNESFWEKRQLR